MQNAKSRYAARCCSTVFGGSAAAAVCKWIAPDVEGRTRIRANPALRQLSYKRGETICPGLFLLFAFPIITSIIYTYEADLSTVL